MENGHSADQLSAHDFMADKQAISYFAKLDYALKSGVHIQRSYPGQEALYRFLESNYESLKLYYADFFEMLLTKGGEDWNTYYFIDFNEGSRGNIPNSPQYRQYLKPEYILVGLLLFKLYKLDANIELNRISLFISTLYQEYEEIMAKLQLLLAKVSGDTGSDFSDDKLKDVITKAFAEFELLGWIYREPEDKDFFIYQPSFERLRQMYYPQIIGIDEILKPQPK
jgi:chromosome condensin MukBEF MukE localization factor